MGAILEFTRATSSPEFLRENPLLLPNNPSEYQIRADQLPTFVRELSEELLLMLC